MDELGVRASVAPSETLQRPADADIPLALGNEQDALLKRLLGWPSLAALTFSGMVGSGWLFASYYAAKMAGPMAIVAWVLCAVAMLLVALCFIELGVSRPVAGGNVRWPAVISGPFVGVMVGWVIFLQIAVGTPSEASGLLQYAARWWPALFAGERLSAVGLVIATIALVLFTALNWFGVELMARVNNLITIFKIVVPLLTVALLLASGFHASNIQTGGGWAPYGPTAMLTALTGAGLVYAFGGIQTPSMMAGEARNPKRDIPIGTFVGFGAAFVLYMLLQTSFLGTVPQNVLAKAGWNGIDFNSPFAQLATLLSLGWLAQLLMVDAVVSPGGSLFMGIGINARNTYGLGQNRTFPSWVARVHPMSGVPRNALLLNLLVSILFLFVFQSWQGLVSALGMFFAVGYAAIAVAAGANASDPRLQRVGSTRMISIVAPLAFVISALIMFWAGWPQVRLALILFAISIPLFVFLMSRDREGLPASSFRSGLWFVVLMLLVGLLSWMGSFKGMGWIPSPVDSLLVGVVALTCYFWGLAQSRAWMRSANAGERVVA
jgi:amino acid transporter